MSTTRRHIRRRTGQASAFQAWAGAMLALAPLLTLVWAMQTTGIGIA